MLKRKENQTLALRYCNYLRECLEDLSNSDLDVDDLGELLYYIDDFQTKLHKAIYTEN